MKSSLKRLSGARYKSKSALVFALLLCNLLLLGGIRSGYALCGNNANTPGGNTSNDQGSPDPQGDPFAPYTGNEFRNIPDLKVWGGAGEHQLVFSRWANSRTVNGPQYFGTGHNWRHSYQWDISDAGANAAGHPQLDIIYPDGTDQLFAQSAAGSAIWTTKAGITDTLTQNGNTFLLQRKNGWVYTIAKLTNPDGSIYYRMVSFADSQQNRYVLTYNAAGEVTQVTEPGGRYIQIICLSI